MSSSSVITIQDENPERQCELTLYQTNKPAKTVSTFIFLDSGSKWNLISINHPILSEIELITTDKPLKLQGAFGNNGITAKHTVKLDISFKHCNTTNTIIRNIAFYIIDAKTSIDCLLGFKTMTENGIVVGSETGIVNKYTKQINRFSNNVVAQISYEGLYLLRDETQHCYRIEHPYTDAVLRIQKRPSEDTNFLPYIQIPVTNNQAVTDCRIDLSDERWQIVPSYVKGMQLAKCLKIETRALQNPITSRKRSLIEAACKRIHQDMGRDIAFRLRQVLTKYHESISEHELDIGRCNVFTCKVKTTNQNPQPCKTYELPHAARRVIHEEIKKLVEYDILQPDPNITVVTGSFLAVPKPKRNPADATSWRIVFDGIAQNNVIQKEHNDIPKIERILNRAANHKILSSLDCRKAFWSICIDPTQQSLFTVQDPITGELLKWKRLAMGSSVGSHVMQRASQQLLLKGVNRRGVMCYIDDFLCFSNKVDDHFDTLEQILGNFVKYSFKLNAAKCEFFQKKITAFGFEVSELGVRPSPKRVEAFKLIKKPTTKKQMKKSLGSFSYYRRAVKNFAGITAPLYNALKGDGKSIIWNSERNAAWKATINQMQESTLLTRADHSKEFFVFADTSRYAVGACLKQKDDEGKLTRLISCYSYKLKPNEISWENSIRELMGVFKAVQHYEYYLFSKNFTIVSDSRVVCLALKAKRTQIGYSGKLSPAFRFLSYLNDFDFQIEHSSGESPQFMLTDLLSRQNINPQHKMLMYGSKSKEPLLFVKDVLSGKMDGLYDSRRTHKVLKLDAKVLPNRKDLWEQIQMAQTESRRIRDLKNRIKDGTTKGYRIDDDTVYTMDGRIVIPPHFVTETLNLIHHHNDGAGKLIRRFNDYGCFMEFKYREIQNHIRSCNVCLQISPQGLRKFTDRTVNDLTDINQSISVDVMKYGSIPVMVACDEYSDFGSACIMKSENAFHTVEALASLLLRRGPCQHVRSDNGRNFIAEETKQFFEMLGIQHSTSIVRNSRGNNKSEALIHRISKELKVLNPSPDGKDLESAIAIALLKINTEKKRGEKYSPMEITIGRDNGLVTQCPEYTDNKIQSLDDRMKSKYKHLLKIRESLIADKRRRLKELGDRINQKPKTFKTGDLVKISQPPKLNVIKKLQKPFSEDTYKIQKILPYANSAIIQRLTNSHLIRPRKLRAHLRQLKRCGKPKITTINNDWEPIFSDDNDQTEKMETMAPNNFEDRRDKGRQSRKKAARETKVSIGQPQSIDEEIKPTEEIAERIGTRRSPRGIVRKNYKY